jgi:phosphate transport system permease protein
MTSIIFVILIFAFVFREALPLFQKPQGYATAAAAPSGAGGPEAPEARAAAPAAREEANLDPNDLEGTVVTGGEEESASVDPNDLEGTVVTGEEGSANGVAPADDLGGTVVTGEEAAGGGGGHTAAHERVGYPMERFFLGKEWNPEPPTEEQIPDFGLIPLLLSSLMVTLGAILIAVPLGLMSAIYIAEIAPPRVRDIMKPAVELLAAIPSVVLGFFGFAVLAGWIKAGLQLSTGVTMLTGSIMLAFMAIPTIATISEDAITAVSREIRAGSLGLGATHWQTIRHVVVPAAFSGIIASIMLGIGRAIGETMVVLMVTGNGIGPSLTALMNDPGNPLGAFRHFFGAYAEVCRTLTATIAAEMGEVVRGGPHYRVLFLLGVVLFIITFIVNLIADFALMRAKRI